MSTNTLPSERAAVVAVIDPDAATAAAYNSGWISMATFQSVMAIIQTGTLGTSATVDGKLQQATDSSGTGVKDIAGKAITQLVKATNDDDQAIIQCRSAELDVDNLFNHVRLVMTVGTATSDASAIVIGFDARHAPASDLASVVEIVS
tara:strand:+ start:280 stop:723 length:444 start_codon:yes stop_codon:yes gene_type:complete